MKAQGVNGVDDVHNVHNGEREVIVISDSSADFTSEAHSNVESGRRGDSNSTDGLLEGAEESVKSICEAIQHFCLALAETLVRIEVEIDFLEEHGMLQATILRPHLNLCRGLLLRELRELEILSRRHDHGLPLPRRRNTAP